MSVSDDQAQSILNEGAAQARSEQQMQESERTVLAWSARSDRWRLPVPETETDPAEAGTHSSPLGAISWMFPATGRDQLPVRFWTLMDRLWGVLQADEAPTRILVEGVSWPTDDPTHSPTVQIAESDQAWGAKLLAMMVEVRNELARQPGSPDLTEVTHVIRRLQIQLETLETPAP
ncbi:MAG: hypothetical protein L0J57_02850 [Brachybacterium sp.]|nr:hypothetical protein [Kocuria sp.]MDN6301977.1 hypothetical protein [Brachybacterium sp.]